MAKKVNIDAVTAAIIAQERYFAQVSCKQQNTILYGMMLSLQPLTSIRPELQRQRRWDGVSRPFLRATKSCWTKDGNIVPDAAWNFTQPEPTALPTYI